MLRSARSQVVLAAGAPLRTLWASSAQGLLAPLVAKQLGGTRSCSFTINFVSKDGEAVKAVTAKSGQTVLQVAHENDIDIEGACGGECACSTCHVILDKVAYDAMPAPDDDEADMLDLAAHVTETSRLGCQIKLLKERDDGLRVQIPAGTVNLLG